MVSRVPATPPSRTDPPLAPPSLRAWVDASKNVSKRSPNGRPSRSTLAEPERTARPGRKAFRNASGSGGTFAQRIAMGFELARMVDASKKRFETGRAAQKFWKARSDASHRGKDVVLEAYGTGGLVGTVFVSSRRTGCSVENGFGGLSDGATALLAPKAKASGRPLGSRTLRAGVSSGVNPENPGSMADSSGVPGWGGGETGSGVLFEA